MAASCVRHHGFRILCKRLELSPQSRYATGRQCATAAVQKTEDEPPLVIPKRKQRDKYSVLRVLASNLDKGYDQPHYSFIDDPFLIPETGRAKKNALLAKASGKKAARYVLDNYPEFFKDDEAAPPVPVSDGCDVIRDVARGLRRDYESLSASHAEDTLEGLQERIRLNQPLQAHTSYTRCLDAGLTVPAETVLSLLELLCFYNSTESPAPFVAEENFVVNINEYLTREGLLKKKSEIHVRKSSWKYDDLADQLFSQISEPGTAAYSSIIKGRAKYNAVDKAYDAYLEAADKNIALDVAAYDALLRVLYARHKYSLEGAEEGAGWREYEADLQELLRHMAAHDVTPTAATFTAALLGVAQFEDGRKGTPHARRELCGRLVAEMDRLGLEPSCAAYFAWCEASNNDAAVMLSVISRLADKELVPTCPEDFLLARQLMRAAAGRGQLALGYDVDRIFHTGLNYKLLGDEQIATNYYEHYIRLLCDQEAVEKTMDEYFRLSAYAMTAYTGTLRLVLKKLDSSDQNNYLPRIWNDIVTFGQVRNAELVEGLLAQMARKKDTNVDNQELFVSTAWQFMAAYYNSKEQARNRVTMTGPMAGSLIQVFLHGEQVEYARDVLEEYVDNKFSIGGFPSEDSLNMLYRKLVEQKEDSDILMMVIEALAHASYPSMDSVAEDLRTTRDLSTAQLQKLQMLL